MDANREIKVYGTLVNGTVGTISDATHNDVLVNAYQVYDSRFINNGGINNYLDIINKRVTGITYNNGVTTITGDLQSTGNIQAPNLVKRLADLQDIDLAGITSGKYLKYDGVKWVPSTIAVSDITGGISLDNISNVNTAGATNGSVLKYNGSQWVAGTDESGAGSIGQLSDVSTAGAVNGSVLKYNGSKWVVGTDNTGTGGATVLNELGDVTISSPSNKQILSYNGSQWVNKTVGVNDIAMPSAQEGQVLKYRSGSWVAANDETGSGGGGGEVAPAGYEFVTQTVTRVYNKIGEVSGLFTTSSGILRNSSIYPYAYPLLYDSQLDKFLNPIRNKSYIYTCSISGENIPDDAIMMSDSWINIPDNLYVYMYKYNNILSAVRKSSSETALYGLPPFSNSSSQEGRAVYYKNIKDAMSSCTWIGHNSAYVDTAVNGRLYYGAGLVLNGFTGGYIIPSLMISSGDNNDFSNYQFSKVSGNAVIYETSQYLILSNSQSFVCEKTVANPYDNPSIVASSVNINTVKADGLVDNIPEIAPNTVVQQIYAADDINMPQTITQVVVYKYLRPIQ